MRIVISMERGFTLVELAVVVIISGLMLVAAVTAYESYLRGKDLRDTETSTDIILAALSEFRDITGRYPCPADRTLSPTDPGYGIENCTPSAVAPACGEPDGICRVFGRDADDDTNADPALIGEIPFTTIGETNQFTTVPMTYRHDAWGNKFTYAITESLTSAITFDPARGVIGLEDEHEQSILETDGTVHLVVLSHGENGKGAYTRQGRVMNSCLTSISPSELPPVPGPSDFERDVENCEQLDATFSSSLYSLGDSNKFFDDVIKFQNWGAQSMWTYQNDDSANIYNTNPGNVGFGVDDPETRLHIGGALEGARVYALGYGGDYPRSAEDDCAGDACGLCDETGTHCMPATVLGGDLAQMWCRSLHGTAPPYGVNRIENNRVYCEPLAFTRPSESCPPGTGVRGLRSDGTLICEAP